MSAFPSIYPGLIVLHQKAAIWQCDIHHIYYPYVKYCSLFSHSWLMILDCRGSVALHTKVNMQTMDAVRVAALILESQKFQERLEGGWEELQTVRVLPIISLLVCMCVQLREQQKRHFMMVFGLHLDVFANKKTLRKQWNGCGRGTFFYCFLYLPNTITLEWFLSHSHQ